MERQDASADRLASGAQLGAGGTSLHLRRRRLGRHRSSAVRALGPVHTQGQRAPGYYAIGLVLRCDVPEPGLLGSAYAEQPTHKTMEPASHG